MALLPGDFPPKSTVWRYFDRWRSDGTLEKIHDRLRTKVRAAEKPYHPRTTASVDSQSVDASWRRAAGPRQCQGRRGKRPVVDRMGLLLAVVVTAASVDDAAAAPTLFSRLVDQPMGRVRRMFADAKYRNFKLYEWVDEHAKWDLRSSAAPRAAGLGEAADPLDGRADVGLVEAPPAAERGPGEEHAV